MLIDMDNRFPWYRCRDCHGLITALQEAERVPSGEICPCGAHRYKPAEPRWWEYLSPSVWAMYFALWRGEIVIASSE